MAALSRREEGWATGEAIRLSQVTESEGRTAAQRRRSGDQQASRGQLDGCAERFCSAALKWERAVMPSLGKIR